MSGVVTSANFAKALWPGVNEWYGQTYNEYEPQYTKLFDTYTSNRQWEEDVGYSGYGLLVEKPEGTPIQFDSDSQGFTTRYTHTVYALGFVITREIYEDDLYDVVGKRKAQALAMSVNQTKEVVAANVYNRATNGSYVYGDGVSLLSSSIPNVAGGTWSNMLSTAADLSEAALEQANIDIQRFTNDAGLRIAIKPKTLIITPDQQAEAVRILKSAGRVDTPNNDTNFLRTMGIIPEIVVNQYLTDTDAWFIRTNLSTAGLRHFKRWEDRFEMDNDFDTENAKFKAISRYSFGITDKRAIYGSAGA